MGGRARLSAESLQVEWVMVDPNKNDASYTLHEERYV
jgi:hypothetical protein